ncbi:LysR family transcriptional regulator [Streptomyces scabiei]|uniref:LysR family transcriptional regulator n=1 Tax=Streptomyces scabiei TaxID=1930 RepID=UPI0038F6E481
MQQREEARHGRVAASRADPAHRADQAVPGEREWTGTTSSSINWSSTAFARSLHGFDSLRSGHVLTGHQCIFHDRELHRTSYRPARDIGIHQSTLVTQINRLEEDLGQPLLERAERDRAMKLPRFGKRFVTAARKIPAETDLWHGARVQQRRGGDSAEQEGFPAHNR